MRAHNTPLWCASRTGLAHADPKCTGDSEPGFKCGL